MRGEKGRDFHFKPQPGHQPLYLFPSEDARPLTQEYAASFKRPIQLVVPDATWKQARKFHKREPSLAQIPRVKVAGGFERLYTLRKSPSKDSVCTLEAIALALGALEGNAIKAALLKALNTMNQRVEISRNPSLWNQF